MNITKTCNNYMNKINEELKEFYCKKIINKKDIENCFRKSFYDIFEKFSQNKNKYAQFLYDIKIIKYNEVKVKKSLNDYGLDYHMNMYSYDLSTRVDKLKVIYTNAEDEDLRNFDYSKVYIILDDEVVPDLNYSYLIKENLYYIYIPDIK